MSGRGVRFRLMIGYFSNSIALRVDLSGNPTFLKLINRVTHTMFQDYAHQDLSFELVVKELNPSRDTAYHPIFQTMFVLQNMVLHEFELCETVIKPIGHKPCSIVDIDVDIIEEKGILKFDWMYNQDLFEQYTMKRMTEHFKILLNGIIENPKRRLSELPVISEAEERQQLIFDWNNTKAFCQQKKSLPEPEGKKTTKERIVPRNSLERKLAIIWEKSLNVSDISITDNFFDMWGHSLLAVKLLSEIRHIFEDISIAALFEYTTIETLASFISSKTKSEKFSS